MRYFFAYFSILPQLLLAQGESLSVAGISLSHVVMEDSLELTITAPTTGWVGVGFNQENNIVGSDLLLFHVVDDQIEGADLYVAGFGDPRSDESLGGQKSVRIISGSEYGRETKVTFRIALDNSDPYDFQHQPGVPLWLILAYSTHDDFEHHSRLRKHVQHQF
ncbi:MAG: DOMON domain-containing protein [Bacteroidota bacterium]